MKKFMLLFTMVFIGLQSYAVGTSPHAQLKQKLEQKVGQDDFSRIMSQMTPEEISQLTPKKYKKLTGKRLGFKNALKLKLAKKMLKSKGEAQADIPKGLYVVLAIIGLGWLAIGLLDQWSGNTWIIALVLALLLWLPGVIYSLIMMSNYY